MGPSGCRPYCCVPFLNQMVRTVEESIASEMAIRMQSMKQASENAGKLGHDLALQYNRQRQDMITSALIESLVHAEDY